MKPRGAESRFCWFRPTGGRVQLGTSLWCRCLRDAIARSSTTAAGRDEAESPRMVTPCDSSPPMASSCYSSSALARCHAVGFAIGGQIVQAMAIERPDLVASLTIAATGPGSRRLDGTPREVGPEALEEIEKIGFEKYIRAHIDNDHMAYNPEYYRDHREVAASLAQALWSGQSTVEQYHIHELARLSWDTLAEAPKVKVPTLVLCGADDGVERRGSTPAATAKMLAPLIPGAELALIPGADI